MFELCILCQKLRQHDCLQFPGPDFPTVKKAFARTQLAVIKMTFTVSYWEQSETPARLPWGVIGGQSWLSIFILATWFWLKGDDVFWIETLDMFFSSQKRRRRLDRNMIGEPMNFVHTAHVGAREMSSDYSSVSVHLWEQHRSPLSNL